MRTKAQKEAGLTFDGEPSYSMPDDVDERDCNAPMETKRTPTPWKYDGAGFGNIRPVKEDGRNVCTFTRAFSSAEQMMNDANARFICKAVNSFERVERALALCHDVLHDGNLKREVKETLLQLRGGKASE